MRLNYAIVFVTDMAASVAFYRDSFNLPVRFESPEWTEFATEGAVLALHRSARSSAEEPGSNHAGRCRPGFAVPDLDAFQEHAVARGVRCRQAPKAQFGVRIAQYLDPDGLVISVSSERGEDSYQNHS